MGSIIGPAYLDSWAGSERGEECTSTSSTFVESAMPKGASRDRRKKWAYMYLGQFSLSRRDIIVSSLGLHAKAFVRLRQLHWLKRFLSTYCRQPIRAHSGSLQGYPTFAF
jgi:hypothetical protein